MAHIPLGPKQTLTTYRKISIASWRHPRDPSTYSWLDLPVAEAEAFLKNYPAETRPSLTHYVAKILAHCLEEHSDLNHLLRARNLYRRAQTDIFITTLMKTGNGHDLSGFTLRDVPGQTLGGIAGQSEMAVRKLKAGEDPETQQVDTITRRVPLWLLRPVMAVQDFLQYTLNMSLTRFGVPDDRFGSAIITNFGVLGIDNALVPLSPYCRCPLIVGMGRTRPMPVVRDGQIAVAECVTISFTFDHRYADGVHGGLLLRKFQKVFLKPHRYTAVFAAADHAEAAPANAEAEQSHAI